MTLAGSTPNRASPSESLRNTRLEPSGIDVVVVELVDDVDVDEVVSGTVAGATVEAVGKGARVPSDDAEPLQAVRANVEAISTIRRTTTVCRVSE